MQLSEKRILSAVFQNRSIKQLKFISTSYCNQTVPIILSSITTLKNMKQETDWCGIDMYILVTE